MASQIVRYLCIIGSLLLLLPGGDGLCVSTAPAHKQFVRIAVIDDAQQLEILIRGKYKIMDPLTADVLTEGRTLPRSQVNPLKGGIQVGSHQFAQTWIRLMPPKEAILRYQDSDLRYRGHMDVLLKKNGKLLVINVLELEQYVKGVLYHEVSDRWPMEAMKAQAVAARTYALDQIQKNKNERFDVRGDIYSQVYGGKKAERFRTNIAVDRTRGQILFSEGKILPAYYHASCGGHTEDVRNLWEDNARALRGVPCDFCRLGRHYTWHRNYRLKDIQDKLNAAGHHLGLIQEIRVLDRNESGRIKNLQITTREGNSVIIPGRKFRDIVGPNLIKSNKYEVVMKGYYFDLIGKGWGHGVGMCQWGAHQMSRERFTYHDILQFYYPGAEIVDCSQKNGPLK